MNNKLDPANSPFTSTPSYYRCGWGGVHDAKKLKCGCYEKFGMGEIAFWHMLKALGYNPVNPSGITREMRDRVLANKERGYDDEDVSFIKELELHS